VADVTRSTLRGVKRIRLGARATRYVVRHPVSAARFASYLAGDDGTALGHWLRRELSVEQRRRLGATVLAKDDVAFEFEGDGFVWAAPSGDTITTGLLATGEYSGRSEILPLLAWLERNTSRSGRTVVEVGANIGTTTVPLAAEGFRVLAAEPVPTTFAFLCRNVEANGVAPNVDCIQVAIASGVSSVSMTVGRWHGINRVVDAPSESTIDVEAIGLATLVAEREVNVADIHFVWCDAEGSEAAVIETGAALWAAGVPLFAEFGLVDLTTAVAEHFDSFLPARDIFQAGADARSRPISALASLECHAENVLYLPKGAMVSERDEEASVAHP
jgi:FkbM family methyltransferase